MFIRTSPLAVGRPVAVMIRIGVLLAACHPAPVASQTILATNAVGDIRESFDTAKVSGSPLVGFRVGPQDEGRSADSLDPDQLFVYFPPNEKRKVCVRAVTQDGRFSATGRYAVVDPGGRGGFARLHPVTRKFAARLKAYAADELAVRAYLTDSPECGVAGSIHLPLVFKYDRNDPPSKRGVLSVLVNSRSQQGSATLVGSNGAAKANGSSSCKRIGNKSLIAFDTICRLDLPKEGSGDLTVLLKLNDGFSDTEYRVDVLPPVPSS